MEDLEDNYETIVILNFFRFLCWFHLLFSLSLSKPKLSDITLQEGKMLPSIQELVDLNGDIIDERSLSNGKVLLNVWASWCITCLVEHPFLSKLSKGEDLIIIGINYKDDLSKAKNYLDENGDPYKFSIFDYKSNYALKLGVTGAPETFLVIDGKIVKHRIGKLIKKFGMMNLKYFLS